MAFLNHCSCLFSRVVFLILGLLHVHASVLVYNGGRVVGLGLSGWVVGWVVGGPPPLLVWLAFLPPRVPGVVALGLRPLALGGGGLSLVPLPGFRCWLGVLAGLGLWFLGFGGCGWAVWGYYLLRG